MVTQPFSNFKTLFSQKEETGGYDNIALNQRNELLRLDICSDGDLLKI